MLQYIKHTENLCVAFYFTFISGTVALTASFLHCSKSHDVGHINILIVYTNP